MFPIRVEGSDSHTPELSKDSGVSTTEYTNWFTSPEKQRTFVQSDGGLTDFSLNILTLSFAFIRPAQANTNAGKAVFGVRALVGTMLDTLGVAG